MADIPGTSGNDSQRGTEGSDVLKGLEGDDHQRGGKGDDTYEPGPGRDTIQIEPEGGDDTVVGFEVGTDTLLFSGFTNIKSFDDLKPFITHGGGSSLIDVTAANGLRQGTGSLTILDQSVTVREVDTLSESDFAFTAQINPDLAPSPAPAAERPPERMPFEEFPSLPEPPPDPFPRGPNPGPDPPDPFDLPRGPMPVGVIFEPNTLSGGDGWWFP
jgi:hypothetical protein